MVDLVGEGLGEGAKPAAGLVGLTRTARNSTTQ